MATLDLCWPGLLLQSGHVSVFIVMASTSVWLCAGFVVVAAGQVSFVSCKPKGGSNASDTHNGRVEDDNAPTTP